MAGIEEAFEKFADRLSREESKRYIRNQEGDYVEYLGEQDPYPVKLGPLQLGANANITTGKYYPDEYQNISTMNRNVGLRGKYNIPESGIALLGSIGDVRNTQNVRTDLPFNPMTGEANPYSEIRKDVYKQSPYSVGAQYNPKGTDQLFSALYNKGGGYNLGYNQGPINVSYTSNPGLGNNIMLRGQYTFADGGRAGYGFGGLLKQVINDPKMKDVFSKTSPETAQAISVSSNGGGLSSLFRNIFNAVSNIVRPVTTGVATPNVIPTTPTEVIPPTTNPLTRPLGMAGFGGSEIVDILKRLGYTFADGGSVQTGLTKTVPPVKGPDPQGVETLFKKRYS